MTTTATSLSVAPAPLVPLSSLPLPALSASPLPLPSPSPSPSPSLGTSKKSITVLAFKEAIAGVLGTIFSSNIVYPIDFVKTRMQIPGANYKGMIDAAISIIKEEGFFTLYTGLDSELLKSGIQHFVYIYVYSYLRDYFLSISVKPVSSSKKCEFCEANSVSSDKNTLCTCAITHERAYKHLPASLNFIIGCFAGAVTQLFITPLSVVQTRIMTAKKSQSLVSSTSSSSSSPSSSPSLFSMLLTIARDEGWSALFSGLLPSLVLTTNPAIQFLMFDRLKLLLLQIMKINTQNKNQTQVTNAYKTANHDNVGALWSFIIGSIAKIIATVVTYPYIMAKVRLQWRGSGDTKDIVYTGTIDVIRSILLRDGLFGLYVGLGAQMWKSVLGAALMFMGKDQITDLSERIVDNIVKRITGPTDN